MKNPVPRGRQGTPELFKVRAFTEADIPELPELTEQDRLSWDYETHDAGRRHPMTLTRRTLNELEIRSIETCYRSEVKRTSNEASGVVRERGITRGNKKARPEEISRRAVWS